MESNCEYRDQLGNTHETLEMALVATAVQVMFCEGRSRQSQIRAANQRWQEQTGVECDPRSLEVRVEGMSPKQMLEAEALMRSNPDWYDASAAIEEVRPATYGHP